MDFSSIVVLLSRFSGHTAASIKSALITLFPRFSQWFSLTFTAMFISLVAHIAIVSHVDCLPHLLNYKLWSQQSALNILSVPSTMPNLWLYYYWVSYSIDMWWVHEQMSISTLSSLLSCALWSLCMCFWTPSSFNRKEWCGLPTSHPTWSSEGALGPWCFQHIWNLRTLPWVML